MEVSFAVCDRRDVCRSHFHAKCSFFSEMKRFNGGNPVLFQKNLPIFSFSLKIAIVTNREKR